MDCNMRREMIFKLLETNHEPLNAAVLAKKFNVTRQIIVSDIALLRANGKKIVSCKQGYYLDDESSQYTKEVIICKHTLDNVLDELYTIVDNGGKVVNVFVEHPIYGQITGELNIASRYDANEFARNISDNHAAQLCDLTDGIHYHTILCSNREAIERIKKSLEDMGILLA